MKLAVIAPAAVPANTANSIQVMKMAQAYAQLGHNVLLLYPGKRTESSWEELAEHYGLSQQFEFENVASNRFFRGYDYALRAIRRARKWGADLVHTRLPQAAAWAADNNVPTVFELHDLPTGTMGPRLFNIFTQSKAAKSIVVISKKLTEALQTEFEQLKESNLIQVHPDGVDLERFASLPNPKSARKQLGLRSTFTVGYTGSLYAGRGINLILELASSLPEMNFLIVGGRPHEVEALSSKIGKQMMSNISLAGFVPNSQLALYQAACDILLMPYQSRVSASSGGDIAPFLSPMKMFEYLASGRPILASDLAVLAEVLNPKNALILPSNDLGQWISAIKKLKASKGLRESYSSAAQKTAAKYSWEKRAAAILNSPQLTKL
jgi:glycosyltransferase involved in cell wall biosynthesis